MVPNLEYNACMTVTRDNTSSSIVFFNSARADVVTNSPPYLAICSSLAIHLFSTMRKWTLKIVASSYALVVSANAIGCLRTSDMITRSSNCIEDVWYYEVDIIRDYTTLCWDSSNEMLSISPSSWSPRIFVSPWSLGTYSSSRCSEAGGLTSWWWGMRSMSCSNSYRSISVSICSSDRSISWAKSCSCDDSPCLPNAICSDESTTYTSVVSLVCTSCTPVVPVLATLPSPICATLVPFGVTPSTHATLSLFPPFFVSLSTFARFSCRIVDSSPL